jgi:hypothetical protein
MDPRKTLLLEMKRKAGLATPEDIHVLDNTPLIIGDGLAALRPSASVEDWHARWNGLQSQRAYTPGLDDAPDPGDRPGDQPPAPPAALATYTDDGMVLCKPGEEPPPAGKPGYRPVDGTEPSRRTLRERYIAARRAGRG